MNQEYTSSVSKRRSKSTIVSVALLTLSLSLHPERTMAAEATTETELKNCQEQVDEAERVIDLCTEALEKQQLYIESLETRSNNLERALNQSLDELEKQDKWYRDPTVVAPISFSLGLVVGIFLLERGR